VPAEFVNINQKCKHVFDDVLTISAASPSHQKLCIFALPNPSHHTLSFKKASAGAADQIISCRHEILVASLCDTTCACSMAPFICFAVFWENLISFCRRFEYCG